MLQSVSKLNLKLASNGTLLNMKFLPSFFDGPEALAKFATLFRGFAQLHIPHVQFNVVSAATLRAAQANPEEYRSLVVRVAGYSAYFTELDKELQDEIIRRTEFGDVWGVLRVPTACYVSCVGACGGRRRHSVRRKFVHSPPTACP